MHLNHSRSKHLVKVIAGLLFVGFLLFFGQLVIERSFDQRTDNSLQVPPGWQKISRSQMNADDWILKQGGLSVGKPVFSRRLQVDGATYSANGGRQVIVLQSFKNSALRKELSTKMAGCVKKSCETGLRVKASRLGRILIYPGSAQFQKWQLLPTQEKEQIVFIAVSQERKTVTLDQIINQMRQ